MKTGERGEADPDARDALRVHLRSRAKAVEHPAKIRAALPEELRDEPLSIRVFFEPLQIRGSLDQCGTQLGTRPGTVEWKVDARHGGTPGSPTDTLSTLANRVVKEVAKRTNGRIEGNVFPASQLGNNVQMIEQLQLGTLECTIGAVAFLSGAYPPVTIFDLPFVFPEKTYFGGMHQLSVLGLAGCMMSILIGLRLFLAIRKSGNLDRKDE